MFRWWSLRGSSRPRGRGGSRPPTPRGQTQKTAPRGTWSTSQSRWARNGRRHTGRTARSWSWGRSPGGTARTLQWKRRRWRGSRSRADKACTRLRQAHRRASLFCTAHTWRWSSHPQLRLQCRGGTVRTRRPMSRLLPRPTTRHRRVRTSSRRAQGCICQHCTERTGPLESLPSMCRCLPSQQDTRWSTARTRSRLQHSSCHSRTLCTRTLM